MMNLIYRQKDFLQVLTESFESSQFKNSEVHNSLSFPVLWPRDHISNVKNDLWKTKP